MTQPRKKTRRKRDSNPGSSALEADTFTTRPTRLSDTRAPSANRAGHRGTVHQQCGHRGTVHQQCGHRGTVRQQCGHRGTVRQQCGHRGTVRQQCGHRGTVRQQCGTHRDCPPTQRDTRGPSAHRHTGPSAHRHTGTVRTQSQGDRPRTDTRAPSAHRHTGTVRHQSGTHWGHPPTERNTRGPSHAFQGPFIPVDWHSVGYPARLSALPGNCQDWLARCQYTVSG